MPRLGGNTAFVSFPAAINVVFYGEEREHRANELAFDNNELADSNILESAESAVLSS